MHGVRERCTNFSCHAPAVDCPEPDRWSELADPARRDALEHHLDTCEDCRALLAVLTQVESPAAWAPALTSAGAQIGRYVIEGTLGSGGMGVVLAAHDPQLERTVALKLVRIRDRSPAALERARGRLVAEARAMARLDHPNVVTVHEIVEDDRELVIVMERVDGADLGSWLAAEPRSRADRLRTILDAGRGLVAAHAAGLVHRDVKPANILVDRAGRARLTDLGLAAAIVGDDEPGLARGSESRLIGTPGYLAPEVLAGARGDERADQYAFAITARDVLGDRRTASVLQRASAELARDRFGSVAEMLAALERAERPRWPWLLGFAAIVVAGATVGLAWPRGATDPCTTDATEQATWTPARRALLGGAMRDPTHLSSDVLAMIDTRTSAWSDEATAACRAHDGARAICLEDQRRDLEATLASVPGATAAHALSSIAHLATAAECAHPSAIANVPEYERVHAELRRWKGVAATGNYAAARDGVAALAKTTTDPSLSAAIAYRHADWTGRAGDSQAAVELAHEAVTLAERARDDRSRLSAMVVLIGTLDDLGRVNETKALAPLLEAAAARQPLSDTQRGLVENVLGNLMNTAGDYAVAERHYRGALAAVEREYAGKPAPEVAGALMSVGNTLHEQAKVAQAKPLIEQAAAMFTATAGPDHPDLAIALTELGNIAQEADQLDEAAADYERVIAIRTKALGADHPYVSEPLGFLARIEHERGHDPRAIELYRRARTLASAGFGPDHPMVALFEGHLAELVPDKAEAKELAAHAVVIWDTTGAAMPDAFDAKFTLAQLDYAAGDHAKARVLAEAARAGWAAQPAPYNKTATNIAAWLATHK